MLTAAVLAGYFAVALGLKASYSDDLPAGRRPLMVYHTGIPNTYAAAIWLPDSVGSVEVYENATSIGTSSAIYNHPVRTYAFDGKHWKIVEFELDHDPVSSGKAYFALPVQ